MVYGLLGAKDIHPQKVEIHLTGFSKGTILYISSTDRSHKNIFDENPMNNHFFKYFHLMAFYLYIFCVNLAGNLIYGQLHIDNFNLQ